MGRNASNIGKGGKVIVTRSEPAVIKEDTFRAIYEKFGEEDAGVHVELERV